MVVSKMINIRLTGNTMHPVCCYGVVKLLVSS